MAGSPDLQTPLSAACAEKNKADCGNSCNARPNKILIGLACMRAWGGRWAGSKASCCCCLHTPPGEWCLQCVLHSAWHSVKLAPVSLDRSLVCSSAGSEAAAQAQQERLRQQQEEDAPDEDEPQPEDAGNVEGRDLDDMWEGQDYVGMRVRQEEVDRLLEKYSDAEWIEVDEEENRRIPFHRCVVVASAHPCPAGMPLVTSWLAEKNRQCQMPYDLELANWQRQQCACCL